MYFEDLPRTVGFFFTFAAQVLEKIGSADNKNGSEVAPGFCTKWAEILALLYKIYFRHFYVLFYHVLH